MKKLLTPILLLSALTVMAQRQKLNFNGNWQIRLPQEAVLHPGETRTVTLPHAWNEDWAYRVDIHDLPDDTCRYTKRFTVPHEWKGRHVFIEFEGARQSAEVWLNGHRLGLHQNGVMAFGFELTPYLLMGKENCLEVLTDNDWSYKEKNPDGTPLGAPAGAAVAGLAIFARQRDLAGRERASRLGYRWPVRQEMGHAGGGHKGEWRGHPHRAHRAVGLATLDRQGLLSPYLHRARLGRTCRVGL